MSDIAHLTVRHPELVDRLIMVGPAPDPSARTVRTLLPQFAIGGVFGRPALNLVLARDYYQAGARLLLEEIRHMLADEIGHVLPLVQRPAMVVRGERDTIVSGTWPGE